MKFKVGCVIATVAALTAMPVTASAHDNGYQHSHHKQNNGDQQLVGGAIGAVIGGVLGSQVAAPGARTEGSVLGAVIGGVAGAAIAGDGNNSRRHYSGGYNQGYYSGHNGYYSRPVYSRPVYSQPVYSHYSRPYYGRSYYSQPRISINLNSGYYGGYKGYRGYRGHRSYGKHYHSYPRRNRGYHRVHYRRGH